jgi:hypothetical protein
VSGCEVMMGTCEHSNEPLGTIKIQILDLDLDLFRLHESFIIHDILVGQVNYYTITHYNKNVRLK